MASGVQAGARNSPCTGAVTLNLRGGRMVFVRLLWLVAGVCLTLFTAARANADVVLHVAPPHGRAGGGNGSAEAPFTTLGQAVGAWRANPGGAAVTIIVAPGTYRESVEINSGMRTGPLRIRAEVEGKAIISGSDIFTAWSSTEPGILSRDYTGAFPLSAVPDNWPSSLTARITDAARRRDMVFLNGVALQQVERRADLRPGTFFIDREAAQLKIGVPSGADPALARIEVARRSQLLTVVGAEDIEISGLVFEHAASAMTDAAVLVSSSAGVRISRSVFRLNNAIGLAVHQSRRVVLDGNVMDRNGAVGLSLWRIENLIARDNQTLSNNWRGYSGGFAGWSSAGTKALSIHGAVFERHRSNFNLTHGFWLDYDIRDTVVRDAEICDNLRIGLIVEAAPGPVEVATSRICRNGQGGVSGREARSLRLRRNVISCNARRQLFVSGSLDRPVRDFVTGARVTLNNEGWEVEGNQISAANRGDALLEAGLPAQHWKAFVETLRSSGNVWRHLAGAGEAARLRDPPAWPGFLVDSEAEASQATLCGSSAIPQRP